jgi:hypothetical protein
VLRQERQLVVRDQPWIDLFLHQSADLMRVGGQQQVPDLVGDDVSQHGAGIGVGPFRRSLHARERDPGES